MGLRDEIDDVVKHYHDTQADPLADRILRLPALVALVEAARESVDSECDGGCDGDDTMAACVLRGDCPGQKLRAALSAFPVCEVCGGTGNVVVAQDEQEDRFNGNYGGVKLGPCPRCTEPRNG